jgi:hypothetical protein
MDHIDMVKKAWQYAVCEREGGDPGNEIINIEEEKP